MNHPLIFLWVCICALIAFRLSETEEHLTRVELRLGRAINECIAIVSSAVRTRLRR
jgi:hypothetical protein